MFYPVESLKRGGRFYLCWVADSWPLRFATITQRQLWSQDIRIICGDLLEVMTSESGRAGRRFSLRLSSQLMRGLVRLYQKKVTIFLSELCMLNANVTKHVNKKFVFHEEVPAPVTAPILPQLAQVPEIPENEERVEEMIQRSGNVVANIQDITLKEATLPEAPLLLNDNFGELHPDQPLQFLADRTLEVMMAPDVSAQQHSLELPLDRSADRSDRPRPAPHERQMERLSEHDVTLFGKSVGDELIPNIDVSKEVPEIPELPDLPPPALPPQPEPHTPENMEIEQETLKLPVAGNRFAEPELIELEELEEAQPPAKRRRVRGKVIDKQMKLSSNYLRARIDNCAVELRCEEASEDIVSIRVEARTLLGRAAHAGPRPGGALGHTLARMFLRNLGVVNKRPLADEMEEVLHPQVGHHTRSVLEKIVEEVEPAEPAAPSLPQIVVEDIADLPTQLIETLSQHRKRTAELELGSSPKTPRRSGYTSFRQSHQLPTHVEAVQAYEADKENISDNIPQELLQPAMNTEPRKDLVALASMLQEAGLADLPSRRAEPEQSPRPPLRAPRTGSEGTETPLGSLDRTKVSLGDSEKTTDSMRFIRDQWGTEGTMWKIVKCVTEGRRPLDVGALVARGPLVAGLRSIVFARCFTSILKLSMSLIPELKQHAFIKVRKDPETLEIRDIMLGAKFETT